jgi:hypothetical protein
MSSRMRFNAAAARDAIKTKAKNDPLSVVQNPHLPPGPRVLYASLLLRADAGEDHIDLHVNELARDHGVSHSTMTDWINALVDVGAVSARDRGAYGKRIFILALVAGFLGALGTPTMGAEGGVSSSAGVQPTEVTLIVSPAGEKPARRRRRRTKTAAA